MAKTHFSGAKIKMSFLTCDKVDLVCIPSSCWNPVYLPSTKTWQLQYPLPLTRLLSCLLQYWEKSFLLTSKRHTINPSCSLLLCENFIPLCAPSPPALDLIALLAYFLWVLWGHISIYLEYIILHLPQLTHADSLINLNSQFNLLV